MSVLLGSAEDTFTVPGAEWLSGCCSSVARYLWRNSPVNGANMNQPPQTPPSHNPQPQRPSQPSHPWPQQAAPAPRHGAPAPQPRFGVPAPQHRPPQFNTPTPGATPAWAGNPTPPQKPRRTGLIVALTSLGVVVVAGAIISSVLFFGGREPDRSAEAQATPTTSATETTGRNQTRKPKRVEGDVFAERELFFEQQQLPLDGTPLKAVTPEQHAFIDDMKSRAESNGSKWTTDTEWTALALAMDACETSILNSHNVDADTVRIHAATSPIVSQLTSGASEEERIQITNGTMNIAATGVSYICPEDYGDWSSALEEINGDW